MKDRDEKGMAYSFRFLKVSDEVAKDLASDFAVLDAKESDRFDKNGKVVSFSITSDKQIKKIQSAIIKYGVSPEGTDVFASLLTEVDSDIIETPDYVLKVVQEIQTKLTWSFTYVGD